MLLQCAWGAAQSVSGTPKEDVLFQTGTGLYTSSDELMEIDPAAYPTVSPWEAVQMFCNMKDPKKEDFDQLLELNRGPKRTNVAPPMHGNMHGNIYANTGRCANTDYANTDYANTAKGGSVAPDTDGSHNVGCYVYTVRVDDGVDDDVNDHVYASVDDDTFGKHESRRPPEPQSERLCEQQESVEESVYEELPQPRTSFWSRFVSALKAPWRWVRDSMSSDNKMAKMAIKDGSGSKVLGTAAAAALGAGGAPARAASIMREASQRVQRSASRASGRFVRAGIAAANNFPRQAAALPQ